MATVQFSSIIGTGIDFDAAADILFLPANAGDYSFVQLGTKLSITRTATGETANLRDFSLAQATTGNLIFSDTGSRLIAGDNTTATLDDDGNQADNGPLDLAATSSSLLEKNNVIYGLGGADTISAGNGDNIIFGGGGAGDSTDGGDRIAINGATAYSGNNHIYANGGNDTVLFTKPTDTGKTAVVFAGVGNDNVLISGAKGAVTVYGGRGNDTLDGTNAIGNVTIYGGNNSGDSQDGADVLTGGLGNSYVMGNAGTDTLYFDDFGTAAAQTIYGGADNDTIMGDIGGSGSTGRLFIGGNKGADYIDATSHLGQATINGGNGVGDTGDGADTILVGAGNSAHKVIVYGNGGADTITSAAALASGESISVYGGVGADTFNISGARSAGSTLYLNGGDGNDIFKVNDSTLTADATVTIDTFQKTDIAQITMTGGSAIDLVATGLGTDVTLTNNGGPGFGVYLFKNYTGVFTSTNLVLGDGSFFLSNAGSATAGSLTGSNNNDQLIAGGKGDTLSGGAGNDILTGGDGADSINGADGVDTITGGAGNDTIQAGDGGTAIDGIADSSIRGGEGSDLITGGAFEDSINGGLGNDTIAGGLGADTVSGGVGADTFAYKVAEVSAAADTDVDLVTDAFTGEADVIDFTDLTATSLRGSGIEFVQGNGTAAQTLDANAGIYIATNTAADFTEAGIYAALSGIADDLATGDIIYALVSNGADARLVRITETITPGSLAAADDTLEYIARLQGVSPTDLTGLTEGNFTDFS